MPVTVTPDTLLAFKAGRAFRREGSNVVVPDPTKGAILLTNGDDDLLHFVWKNRDTDLNEEVREKRTRGAGDRANISPGSYSFPDRCDLHSSSTIERTGVCSPLLLFQPEALCTFHPDRLYIHDLTFAIVLDAGNPFPLPSQIL